MMTIQFPRGQITTADLRTCSELLASSVPGSSFHLLLQSKMRDLSPAGDGNIDPDTVTINSRVEFKIDDEAPQTRILVRCGFRNGLVGLTLPVVMPRGMALLGLREGQSFRFEENARQRSLEVLRVHYQPLTSRRVYGLAAAARPFAANVVDILSARKALRAQANAFRPTVGVRKP